MVTSVDYQTPLARWQEVYEDFMAQIKSIEPVTMRDRDVWYHAIDVYNAIQLGDVISTLSSYYFPFTNYSPKQRKFTNNMWTITVDENSAVIHKEFTQEGMIYNVRPGDIVEFTISPDDITTKDDWVRDASPAGIKLLNVLGGLVPRRRKSECAHQNVISHSRQMIRGMMLWTHGSGIIKSLSLSTFGW